jgi:hypothetical protein
MASSLNELTTHDLWVAARQVDIDIARPTPTTILLTVRYPLPTTGDIAVLDGMVITLGTKPITANDYPEDGTQYLGGSSVFGAVGADTIGSPQVVGFYSKILNLPFPVGTVSEDGTATFTLTITGTTANQLYYASAHGATNILQYYPIGIQSYPLEASRVEKDSSSYAGSIPSLPSAPVSPTPGQVYYDQQLNLVQYWDQTRSVWIPTRNDNIMSGDVNPGITGHVFLRQITLRAFDGKAWIDVSPENFQVQTGLTWSPFSGKMLATTSPYPAAPAAGDFFYSHNTRRIEYFDGTIWQIPTPTNTLLEIAPSIQVPAFTGIFTFEGNDLPSPYVGLLFYNTSQRQLNVFNGTSWEQVNTSQQGSATTDKTGIGTDGSYDERLRLINILKAQLGYPALCVELSEEQFNVAIDNALDTYRQLSVGAYERRFFIFPLNANQTVYHLNSPQDRTDAVVQVMKIHRMNMYGVTGSGPDNTWGQAWAQQWYNMSGGAGDLLSVHLVHAWSEEYTKIFAGDIPFTWNEARRELALLRMVRTPEKVVLEVELERSEQELLLDRWCKQFIQNWALAECKEYLGMIRSKYSSGTPGPAGTITLNGETMLAEARQDFTELKQALLDYEYQNAEHGLTSFLLA